MNIKEFLKLLQPLLFEDQVSFDRPLCFLNFLVEQSGASCGFSFYNNTNLRCDAKVEVEGKDDDANFSERDFKYYKLKEKSDNIFGLNRQDVLGDNFMVLPLVKEFLVVPWNRSKKETGNFLLGFGSPINWDRIEKIDIFDITRIYELLYCQHHRQAQKLDTIFNFQTKNKNAFLATMSHEIRTPLNVIIGILELLKDTHSKDKIEYYLKIANSNADALMGIVNSVLDFSKINSGKMILNFENGSVYKILDEVVFALSEKAFSKNLELLVSYPVTFLEEVSLDPIRLRQVFNNLIGNAIKFTSKGSVFISVTSVPINKKVEYQVSVKDTGTGIPLEKRACIFKPYKQVESNFSAENSSGLGLSITRDIVRKFGGNISLNNDCNSGSHFLFNMILKKTGKLGNPENWMDPMTGLSVWLIDFDHISLSVTEEILKQTRCHLKSFSNLPTLKEEINRSLVPDCVLIDDRVLFKNRTFFDSFFKHSFIRNSRILILAKGNSINNLSHKTSSLSLSIVRKPILPNKLLETILATLVPHKKPHQHPESKAGSGMISKTLKILIAEDVEANQILFEVQMEKLGHEVTFAKDGKKAWELLMSNNGFDLIFIDLRMPVWDGIYLIKKIRSIDTNPSLRSIYAVALTANTSDEDRNHCLQSGMNDFLTKPVLINDLRNVISGYQQWSNRTSSRQLSLPLSLKDNLL